MTTRIKICGITRHEDAMLCIKNGVDALGLVFYPPSPRNLSVMQAREILRDLPPFITIVALFMNPSREEVEQVLADCRIDRLQFHGSEDGRFCEQFSFPYYKAVAMGDGVQDFQQLQEEYANSSAFLLDSHRRDQAGGSGQAFDWSMVPDDIGRPVILAGGLGPDNVQSAIRQIRPYAVDCSSAVESEPGIKDPIKVRQFVENVQYVSTT
jgi:phosphoribosylanthranilate isomerase